MYAANHKTTAWSNLSRIGGQSSTLQPKVPSYMSYDIAGEANHRRWGSWHSPLLRQDSSSPPSSFLAATTT